MTLPQNDAANPLVTYQVLASSRPLFHNFWQTPTSPFEVFNTSPFEVFNEAATGMG